MFVVVVIVFRRYKIVDSPVLDSPAVVVGCDNVFVFVRRRRHLLVVLTVLLTVPLLLLAVVLLVRCCRYVVVADYGGGDAVGVARAVDVDQCCRCFSVLVAVDVVVVPACLLLL